jgi:hypothetical protein
MSYHLTLDLPSSLFPHGFSTKILNYFFTRYILVTCPDIANRLIFFTLIYGGWYKFWKSSAGFIPRLLSPVWVKIFVSQLCSKTLVIYFSPSWRKTKIHMHVKEQAAFHSGSSGTASYTVRGRRKISSWVTERIPPSPPFLTKDKLRLYLIIYLQQFTHT